jgi:maltose alpha-D-glucosyltransferase/alpha-amylase
MKSDQAPIIAAGAESTSLADDPYWYKDAVIYELHIKAFRDSNGDGLGDFAGLIEKLDHVRDLGVNTIWLLPFYPSPLRDDGYDVADFMNVNPAYGTVADVERLVAEAHRRGLRVITELVVNHTSDRHPWFEAARRAPKGSPERDFYVWSDDPKKYAGTRIIFTDTEKSNWTWDDVAQQYFWHRFFSHQPDLNFDNPAVREAVFGIMEFWLERGVDGFRLDAIPYLVEREGTSNENLRETHEVIKELRQRLDAKFPNRLLLAEANMWPEDVREYFGEDDECHMAYHFPLMPRMYMAIAQEDRHPVVEILAQTPEISPACQWAIFLRNHDELTLEMVTSRERDYMYSMYAADPRARINLGIRRRLAPLLDNDLDRIKLMKSLLLSMPGSPVLYYGDEIGMGDNIFLGDRDGVRTPMQWSSDRNGGFSRADPQRLYLPPIQDPVYGYEAVNVEAQSREPSSLLNWTRRMLAVRSATQVFGRGGLTMLHPGNRKVLAYLRELGEEAVLCVANLGRSAQPVEIDLARFKGRVPVEMLGGIAFPPVGEPGYQLTLPAHGFFWFRLSTDVEPPDWYVDRRPVEDLAVVVLFDGWNSLFRERVVPWRIAMAIKTRAQFEEKVLPPFVARQRWFAVQDGMPARVQLAEHAVLAHGGREWLLGLFDARDGEAAVRWFLPLALAWEDGEDERLRQLQPAAVAKVRVGPRVGVMADAQSDPAFCVAVLDALASGREMRAAQGRLRFHPTGAFAALAGRCGASGAPPRLLPQARSSALVLDDALFMKLLRQVRPGISVEAEVGRFLTDVARFEHCAPVAGTVEYLADDGTASTLVLLQGYVSNQGDAWTLVVDQLQMWLARHPAPRPEGSDAPVDDGFLERMRTLARRLAQLHRALGLRTGDAAFEPQPIEAADIVRWIGEARERAAAVLQLLREHASQWVPAQQALAQQLLEADLEAAFSRAARCPPAGHASRVHGAFRLQEVLLVHNDFVIVDFEGDPGTPVEARRAKHSPLRDVAALLCSLDQAREAALPTGALAETQALAALWLGSVREAVLDAYVQEAVAAGLHADAQAFEAARPLLALFEIDRALQLMREEIAHRPAAAAALLSGLLARLGH